MNKVLLWIAQGFGVGRIPVAPGTFGSVLGLIWFALLLLTGNLWMYLSGSIIGLALSIWLCGVGERMLNAKDPGSVVLDEIAAIPVCFAGWLAIEVCKTGSLPTPEVFFSKQNCMLTIGVFAAFRFFDVLKPWPVRQSQSLPGGWGVTVDDFLAAIYVNVVVLALYGGKMLLSK